MRRLLTFATLLLPVAVAAVLPAGPAAGQAQPAGGTPKGEVLKFTFASSAIFPGTTRDYWVYIPKQYDPAKPACVHVNQDGVQFNAPAVFDELIAKKEMPVTIGVFIQPGRVKALGEAALDRFNRSYEYDGLGDNYVRFLLEELLPDVEKKQSSDGRAIKLSKDGNDRAIGGSSSGAIAAFTAAWERPDAFSRVFSAIGTYVGLRGGNVYPTLIRKYEPKPIRVFLQDGSADLNIYGGDWWMANQEMERAFKFAGYEVNHAWGDGGHNAQHATKLFPEAMRWLWKDWPTPVKAGLGSPQMKEVLLPTEGWKAVTEGYSGFGSLTTQASGAVNVAAVAPAGEKKPRLHQIDLQGQVGPTPVVKASGARMVVQGPRTLYGLHDETILAHEGEGEVRVVAQGIAGNSLVVRHDGSLFVSQPASDKRKGEIWFVSATGEKKVVDQGLRNPGGLTVSPDQSLLYVADGASHWVWSYQIQPDGTLAHKQRYYHLHMPDNADDSGAAQLAVDRDGRLYVATHLGVQFCDQAGRVNGIIPGPAGAVTALCIGGEKMDTLYVVSGDRVWQRKLRVRGAHAFEAPTKPAAPRL